MFYLLNESPKQVYLNPGVETMERYISLSNDEPFIVKHMISESPLNKLDKIEIPSLEKILVDIIADGEIFTAQQAESDIIYRTAFEKYEINTAKLKRYAQRRNRASEVSKLVAS